MRTVFIQIKLQMLIDLLISTTCFRNVDFGYFLVLEYFRNKYHGIMEAILLDNKRYCKHELYLHMNFYTEEWQC